MRKKNGKKEPLKVNTTNLNLNRKLFLAYQNTIYTNLYTLSMWVWICIGEGMELKRPKFALFNLWNGMEC